MSRPFRVVNISEADLSWRWIADASPAFRGDWAYVSTRRRPGLEARLRFPNIGRVRGGLALRRMLKAEHIDLVVSHGPLNTYCGAEMLGARSTTPHLAMSFNFTRLPGALRRQMMARAFRSVDRFVVFSRMERALYARTFDLPEERFDFIHWGVRPPIETPLPRSIEEPYFIAIGNEARDYRPLVEAARMRPGQRFVFVVRPWTLDGLAIPDNVTVHCNLPWEETWSLASYATGSLISLRDGETPNGHVSLVGGMHIGKAHIVSRSTGITDYAVDDETALLVPPGNAQAFADAIDRLNDEPGTVARLGENARVFARKYCTENSTVEYFTRYLAGLRERGRLPA